METYFTSVCNEKPLVNHIDTSRNMSYHQHFPKIEKYVFSWQGFRAVTLATIASCGAGSILSIILSVRVHSVMVMTEEEDLVQRVSRVASWTR
jgi:hypothetical protein